MAERTVPERVTQRALDKPQSTREAGRYLKPPVDIYETDESLVLVADLPGVSKEDLTLSVDNNVLTIEGRPRSLFERDCFHREFTLYNYYRQFELSDRLNLDEIRAELKNGVLTLTLPKVPEAKPRVIPVSIN